ncbi:hypothetical protein [Nakamurella lactea]|nr:hypothetical protein [Nakamurella lactea]
MLEPFAVGRVEEDFGVSTGQGGVLVTFGLLTEVPEAVDDLLG